MDLNYLLARHQVALMQSDRAVGAPSRIAHRDRARAYAARANALMADTGAGATIGARLRDREPA